MANGNFKASKPDFKGSLDVAAWSNTDSDGNTYLAVRFGNRMKLLPNPDKKEEQSD